MNMEAQNQVVETPAETVKTVEQLQHEVARLTVLVQAKGQPVKVAVTDAEFEGILSAMQAAAKADLESGNPKARPMLTLRTETGEIVALSKEQRAKWNPAKKAMVHAHSEAHRKLIPARKAAFARVSRNGDAIVATVHKEGKTGGEYVSLSARKVGKRKAGKGLKKAKPAQVAAHVPAAGNAENPAKVG